MNNKERNERLEKIKSLIKDGLSLSEIGKILGCTRQNISLICIANKIKLLPYEKKVFARTKHYQISSYSDIKNLSSKKRDILKKELNLYRNLYDETGNILFIRNSKKSKLYLRYRNMLQRCYNEKNNLYKFYGLRGIKMCDEWLNGNGKYDGYDCFCLWAMSVGYNNGIGRDNHIDRIDNDGNYSPENCRFVSAKENMGNRRSSIRIILSDKLISIEKYGIMFDKTRKEIITEIKKGNLKIKKLYD